MILYSGNLCSSTGKNSQTFCKSPQNVCFEVQSNAVLPLNSYIYSGFDGVIVVVHLINISLLRKYVVGISNNTEQTEIQTGLHIFPKTATFGARPGRITFAAHVGKAMANLFD